MGEWTPAARRMAFWSALAVALLGVAYFIIGVGYAKRYAASSEDIMSSPLIAIWS